MWWLSDEFASIAETTATEKTTEKKKPKPKKKRYNEYEYVQDLLREKLDTKVKIKNKKIEISFTTSQDLNRILEILNIKEQ